MITRILRFSWLTATLLVSQALWPQTSQTTPGQPAAAGQAASSVQPAASLQEAAGPVLKNDLDIRMTDPFISHAVQATTGSSCEQACLDELRTCEKAGGVVCNAVYIDCINKC
jgi:hypothetical protein